MPDTSPEIEFISIDDLLIEEEKAKAPAQPQQQMPLPPGPLSPASGRPKSQVAKVRRQTIVQRRRNRSGSESALAAAVGIFLIVLAVAAYHFFSPAPPEPMPAAQTPRLFKVPPPPPQVLAAEPLPAVTATALPAEGAGQRIDEPAPAPDQVIDLDTSVTEFLSAWGRAWENTAGTQGAMDPYLDCYAAGFTHEGMDKAAWAADKGRKNRRKDWIRIRLSDIRVAAPMVDDTVQVTFYQDYASSNYSVTGEKTLLLKKSGPAWQIIGIR